MYFCGAHLCAVALQPNDIAKLDNFGYVSDLVKIPVEPIAGNYYPVNTILQLTSRISDEAVALVVERSLGGGSVNEGTMELMLQRRLIADDNRGVAEFLNETMCGCHDCHCQGLTIRGRQTWLFGTINEVSTQRRVAAEDLTYPLIPSFSVSAPPLNSSQSFVKKALPANVKLLTFKRMPAADISYTGGNILLRLSHLYEVRFADAYFSVLGGAGKGEEFCVRVFDKGF